MKSSVGSKFSVLLVCAAVCLIVVSAVFSAEEQFGQLVFEKNSLYQRILVYQSGPIVTLRFGMMPEVDVQSQVNLNNLRIHMLEYTPMTFCGLFYNSEPNMVLVLGLGGGVIPREMHYYFPSAQIDVVEIDSEIPKVAREFFAFREDKKLKVHIDDGRMFVKKQLRLKEVPKYDIIVLDAFNNEYIPFHLMTKEFLEELKGILSDDGVVVANVFYSSRLFDAEFKTFQAVFGKCQAYFGYDSSNAMIVSGGQSFQQLTAKETVERAKMLAKKHQFYFDIITVARQIRPNLRIDRRAEVLTDDLAPVNWLRTQQRIEDTNEVP
jgi:spermidine synthase